MAVVPEHNCPVHIVPVPVHIVPVPVQHFAAFETNLRNLQLQQVWFVQCCELIGCHGRGGASQGDKTLGHDKALKLRVSEAV